MCEDPSLTREQHSDYLHFLVVLAFTLGILAVLGAGLWDFFQTVSDAFKTL